MIGEKIKLLRLWLPGFVDVDMNYSKVNPYGRVGVSTARHDLGVRFRALS
jgi:hypothetical protein